MLCCRNKTWGETVQSKNQSLKFLEKAVNRGLIAFEKDAVEDMEESEHYQKLAERESFSCRGIKFSNAVAYSYVDCRKCTYSIE